MIDTDNLVRDLKQFTEVISTQGQEVLTKAQEDGDAETLLTILREAEPCLKEFISLALCFDDLENQSLRS